LKDCY